MTIRASKLAQQVSAALTEDERTKDAAIEVMAQNGIVTLRSTVASTEIRDAAEEIARAQDGVLDVVNELVVDKDAAEDGTVKVVVPAANVPGSSGSREGYIAG